MSKVTPKSPRHGAPHPALAPPSSNRRCGRGPGYQITTRLQPLGKPGQTASRPFGNTFNVMAPLPSPNQQILARETKRNGCSLPCPACHRLESGRCWTHDKVRFPSLPASINRLRRRPVRCSPQRAKHPSQPRAKLTSSPCTTPANTAPIDDMTFPAPGLSRRQWRPLGCRRGCPQNCILQLQPQPQPAHIWLCLN
jgi:hypothetical protein